ncbi:UDP-N-acetylmuramoyl-L-alanyl-D-glutamate--2,6-diaminopimelate ligase [Proteinivorax hydrogeniformans]|uniref:UDP-N-acetylmuramoyl-L-alanyl-D-glutamate--2,6-diaminopimelate ligase n=1 Tax=Proteinivorax hydrogeniformans TaxID=1826727 RepID=A0AAU8HQ80_9FIRM
MKLSKITSNLRCAITGDKDVEVLGITNDTRKVQAGWAFVAIKGYSTDGHKFIPQALENGASVVIVDRDFKGELPVTTVTVKDSRKALAKLSMEFYGHPTEKLRVIGVTGTNGKTTVTNLINEMLESRGHKTGLFGTNNYKVIDKIIDAPTTTPESFQIQKMCSEILDGGGEYATMEVSSHAVVTKRIYGTDYDIGVFTNLTQDHLDFHKTMDEYKHAKGRFFTSLGTGASKGGKTKVAIINNDDKHAEYFQSVTLTDVVTYGIYNQNSDIIAKEITMSSQGSSFILETWMGSIDIKTSLTGEFNVYNCLAAITVALVEGFTLSEIKNAMAKLVGVPGRFELVKSDQGFSVVVDYAHTPDGLSNVLKTAKEITAGKLITVFGCGGERDAEKRPIMAEVAERYSDFIVITNDNPRSEDTGKIAEEIVKGLSTSANYKVILSRKEAIEQALNIASAKDTVIVAGKGHENYQILADKTIDFDDKLIVEEILRSMKKHEDNSEGII